jgi:NADH dehydrogenase
MKPHVVIVGGGFGGLLAARGLAKAPVQVTLIDRRNHHLFQPLLYQVATAGLSPANIAAPIRAVLRGQKNAEVMMAEVTGVDTQNQNVMLDVQAIHYDYLVLATGSWHSYFGHDEWRKFAPGLKAVSDATDIRRKILLAFEAAEMEKDPEKRKALLTFILVGAGPTGVEMAGSIAELAQYALESDFRHIDPKHTRIILIEANARILAGFPDSLSQKAAHKLKSLRVEIMNGARVEKVDAEGVIVSGTRVYGKTVIWCAGVIASPAGKWLNAEVDRAGRVKVNPDLSAPGHSNVFVIGDTASSVQDGKPLPGVAPVAMQQGKYVASLLRARVEGKKEVRPFHYINKGNLATVGRSFAVADFGKIRVSGFFAWIVWLIVHIYYLIGFRTRILVLIEWAWAYFTFQRGARLITRESAEQ